ncbi:hypothetical protein D3C72_2290950 [compost metagenome]
MRDRIFCRRALLGRIGARQVLDVISRVVVANVLQRCGDGFDQVFLLYDSHGVLAVDKKGKTLMLFAVC